MKHVRGAVLALALILAGCNAPAVGVDPTAIPAREVETPARAPTAGRTSAAPPPGAEEAIMILEPGPASRLVSPLRVAGWADPTFEQGLVVRLVSFEGGEIAAFTRAQIEADVGQRGPFAVELHFSVEREQNALIQVLSHSPRDGGVTHLASVGVILLPEGEVNVVPRAPYPEQIKIDQPAPGVTVRGGRLHVEGVGIGSFEGTLVVELYDEAGSLLAMGPLTVDAPDMGLPGAFSLDLEYSVTSAGPARVVVLDPSPAFDGISHLASVEVTLQP